MFDGWGKRAGVVAIVVLAAVNIVFWGGFYKRPAQKSSFTLRTTTSTAPSHTPTPAPATPSPLSLLSIPGHTLEVSIVGDSIASGHYASGPDTRFRTLILNALSARGPIMEADATPTGASSLSTAVTISSGMDLVILEVGTDDMRVSSAADFGTAFGTLVSSIQANSPHAALVCAGTWSATGAAYDAVIQRDCTAASGRYVSLQQLYDNPTLRGPAGVSGYYGVSDGVAPNDAGHQAIAAALLGAVGIKIP